MRVLFLITLLVVVAACGLIGFLASEAKAVQKKCLHWSARSAVTGRFVPISEAKKNPRETIVFCSKREK